jgi:hypothetical protein
MSPPKISPATNLPKAGVGQVEGWEDEQLLKRRILLEGQSVSE